MLPSGQYQWPADPSCERFHRPGRVDRFGREGLELQKQVVTARKHFRGNAHLLQTSTNGPYGHNRCYYDSQADDGE